MTSILRILQAARIIPAAFATAAIIASAADVFAQTATSPSPRDALRTADSLSKARGVADSVRARHLKFLGDHRFIKEDYKGAAEFYGQAARADSSSVCRDLLNIALGMSGAATQAAQTATNRQAAEIIFTVQVGAFGSRENADNLVRRLSGSYSDITVSPTTSGEQTLYRVRVGTFRNRDEAAKFAENLITANSGLTARVVEK